MIRLGATMLAGAALLVGATPAAAQVTAKERAAWNEPVEPFRIVGNVHYVGAAGVSAFLIVTPDGSILLDGGLPETAPLIARNIEALGFRPADVKYLLNSHAHFDHAGGLAELTRLTKGAMVASERDAPALAAGGPSMPPVRVDRTVRDGDVVSLGGTRMTARVTPGHTKGCTTWTMAAEEHGRRLAVVFHCSTSIVARLVGNTAYPEIVPDYERSFATLRSLESDVFLAPHPSFFRMDEKRRAMSAGGTNPFIDPAELDRFVEASERQFRRELEAQQRHTP